jgi:hypothetical protein
LVKRENATNWFQLPPSDSADSRVDVSSHAVRPFVVQCWLDDSALNRPYPSTEALLARAVVVQFAGEERNFRLANWLAHVVKNDPEFAQQFKKALWSEKHSESEDDLVDEPDVLKSQISLGDIPEASKVQLIDSNDDAEETRVRTQIQKPKDPLAWLNQLLKARIRKLDLSRLQNSISLEKLEVRVALRLRELGSLNSNPAISPVNSSQFEAIVSNQLHDDFDLVPLLSVWILAESNTVIADVKDMRPEFVEDICTVASNPYASLNRDARSAFNLVGEMN